ncbi:hypothetical protein EBX93_00385 [bacterium]|nr:hypothetical protein [bacterium]
MYWSRVRPHLRNPHCEISSEDHDGKGVQPFPASICQIKAFTFLAFLQNSMVQNLGVETRGAVPRIG